MPVLYLNDALSRWNRPICPLAAGLAREQGEFVLPRLSQIALKAWHARDPNMYMIRNRAGYVRNFLDTPRPVRIWYHTESRSSEGTALSADSVATAIAGGLPGMAGTSLGMQLALAAQHTAHAP